MVGLEVTPATPSSTSFCRAFWPCSVTRAVMEGEAELGFIEGEVDVPALHVSLVAEDAMRVVVDRSHPFADGRLLGPAELAQANWIMRETGSGTRAALTELWSFEIERANGGPDDAQPVERPPKMRDLRLPPVQRLTPLEE